jgi:hypothetical protein
MIVEPLPEFVLIALLPLPEELIVPALMSAILAPAVVVRLTPLKPYSPAIDEPWLISTVRKSPAVASLEDTAKP